MNAHINHTLNSAQVSDSLFFYCYIYVISAREDTLISCVHVTRDSEFECCSPAHLLFKPSAHECQPIGLKEKTVCVRHMMNRGAGQKSSLKKIIII